MSGGAPSDILRRSIGQDVLVLLKDTEGVLPAALQGALVAFDDIGNVIIKDFRPCNAETLVPEGAAQASVRVIRGDMVVAVSAPAAAQRK